jgi:hypothetical protein
MELSELSHSPGHRQRLLAAKKRLFCVEREIHDDGTEHKHGKFMWRIEKKSFCAFPRGAGKFLHIVAHSVTDRMKNLVLIQFVNGYLGHLSLKRVST